MARDTLLSLIRLRRAACDDAQRSVVRCLAEESRAESAAHYVEREIVLETQAASEPDGSDAVVEAFAAWLPTAINRSKLAREMLEQLQADTARARAGLSVCRRALETVETFQEQRLQQASDARERRWRSDLEGLSPLAERTAQLDASGEVADETGP